ncbi:MAG: RNase adapter RapZ [Rhodospirillaceae bacterium]|nr:RNase adapter RapZ [Rhodospirillaceae bacterium]|tara:strand:- start:41369 stop:42256 length:888 start_codon:yes stop_codon:yes gene_type:complete
MKKEKNILLITGMSGAGKSCVLNILEDLGYEVFDNLPFPLLPKLLEHLETNPNSRPQPLAICADIRTRQFDILTFEKEISPTIYKYNLSPSFLFIDCDDQVIMQRFSETRRKHPLREKKNITENLYIERKQLAWLRDIADIVIDTSSMTIPNLKQVIKGHFSIEDTQTLELSILSFAYRYGLPPESDLVFDVRFLKNPYYVEFLRPLSGNDNSVKEYIEEDSSFTPFFDNLMLLILSLLPSYLSEGKSYLTIAIGCTGGKHRSVHVANSLHKRIKENGWEVNLYHRDLAKSFNDK